MKYVIKLWVPAIGHQMVAVIDSSEEAARSYAEYRFDEIIEDLCWQVEGFSGVHRWTGETVLKTVHADETKQAYLRLSLLP